MRMKAPVVIPILLVVLPVLGCSRVIMLPAGPAPLRIVPAEGPIPGIPDEVRYADFWIRRLEDPDAVFLGPEAIERFVAYYLDLYGKQLQSSDGLARTMALISLARIDDLRVSEKLVEVMRHDKVPIVRVYAWEALHARQDQLSAEQRAAWVEAGFELAGKNFLWGDLRVGLVGVMAVGGPTPRNKRMLEHLFLNSNSLYPGDIRMLEAMGDLLAEWKSPDIIKGLIRSMEDIDRACRAELILRRVNGDIPHSTTLHRLGSKATWEITQKRWAKWFVETDPQEVPAGSDSGYKGHGTLLPRGEKIADTLDPKWRKDLELANFRIRQLDVGFAIDSTGSMGPTVQWIQRDVGKMMRTFELISREPRMGVVLFRDYGDEYVTNVIPLSDSADALSKALSGATAKGGGDIPEAVYTALVKLLLEQKWSRAQSARRVIVLMGDAPPHEATLQKLEQLIPLCVKKGFVFYTFKIRSRYVNVLNRPNYDPDLTSFDKIAEWGNGRSFWVDFWQRRARMHLGCALPTDPDLPERTIFREVLTAAVAEGYRDRVIPFVNVLLQYVERPWEEKRGHFPPYVPPKPSKSRPPPRPPVKPHDPQER